MNAADNSHVLFAIPLALAFVLLGQRRLASMRQVARAQSLVVALVAGLQAWLTRSPAGAVLALAVVAAGGVAVPWLLRRSNGDDTAPPPLALIGSAAMAVLALLVARPREDLSLALGAALVALVVCAARRSAPARLIGLWAAANAVALVASLARAALSPAGLTVGALRLADPLSLLMAALTLAVGLAGVRLARGVLLYPATLLALLLALLADPLPLAWLGAAAAVLLLAATLRRGGDEAAAESLVVVGGAGLALALIGALLFSIAAPAGTDSLRWTTLAAAAARSDGRLMSLAFVFSLLGWGTLAWLGSRGSALLGGLLSMAALVAILRARSLVASNAEAPPPGPLLLALGLLALMIAAVTLWRRRDEAGIMAMAAAMGQSGVVAFAFGLDTEAATLAGVLHLAMLTLVRAALLVGAGRAALVAGLVALAGLPPFGMFASLFLIVSDTARDAPLLAIPLAIGLVGCAWPLARRVVKLCRDKAPAATSPAGPLALAPGWALLALVAWLGLAMPPSMAAWLAAIARGAR